MAYKTQWLIPNRIILTQLFGRVTEEEIISLVAEVEAKLEEGTPLIHHISDGLKMDKIDLNLKTIKLLMGSLKPSERLGWHIEVTRNPINKMVASIGVQFVGVRYRTFNTFQEAIEFLTTNDTTLPEIDPNNLSQLVALD